MAVVQPTRQLTGSQRHQLVFTKFMEPLLALALALMNGLLSTISVSLGIDQLVKELRSMKIAMLSLRFSLDQAAIVGTLSVNQSQIQPSRRIPIRTLEDRPILGPRRYGSEPDLAAADSRRFSLFAPFNITVVVSNIGGVGYQPARAQFDNGSQLNIVSRQLVRRLGLTEEEVPGGQWYTGVGRRLEQLTSKVSLRWYVPSDKTYRDDEFFVAPHAQFDVLFGKQFVEIHRDLVSAVPYVLVCTSFDSRDEIKERRDRDSKAKIKQDLEKARRTESILQGKMPWQEEQSVKPSPSADPDGVEQIGSWTQPNVASDRSELTEGVASAPQFAISQDIYPISIPMSRENSTSSQGQKEIQAAAGASREVMAHNDHPSWPQYQLRHRGHSPQRSEAAPNQDEHVTHSTPTASHGRQTEIQSEVSQASTYLTRPSLESSSEHSMQEATIDTEEQRQDIARLDAAVSPLRVRPLNESSSPQPPIATTIIHKQRQQKLSRNKLKNLFSRNVRKRGSQIGES